PLIPAGRSGVREGDDPLGGLAGGDSREGRFAVERGVVVRRGVDRVDHRSEGHDPDTRKRAAARDAKTRGPIPAVIELGPVRRRAEPEAYRAVDPRRTPRNDLARERLAHGISRIAHALPRRAPVGRAMWDRRWAVLRDVVGHELRGGLKGRTRDN